MSRSSVQGIPARLFALCTIGVAAAVLWSCGGDAGPAGSVTTITVTIDPSSQSGPVGSVLTFFAEAVEEDLGLTSTKASVGLSLTSSATAVATVPPTTFITPGSAGEAFQVTCVSAGTATITAKTSNAHDVGGTAVVTCTQLVPVTRVQVDSNPPPLTAKLGSAATPLPATATDASGKTVAGATFTWTIANPAIASVTPGGQMTPVSPGQTLVTATATGTTVSGTSPLFILGNGSCSITPNAGNRSMTITVQSDPGNHAAQVAFPSSPVFVNFDWTTFQGAAYVIATGAAPFPRVDGGWVSPNNCAFAANGVTTVGSQQNVGARLEGTWSNGTVTLKLTIGTNGELSGGAVVYNVTG
jgi:hypothetical protein